jgi:predicted patatin/cPLA2 family phospholipase
MIDAALVLEGGSLRSLYTAGVLDVFMENNIDFSYIVGVSAGALCAGNYIAKHIGRSAKINILHSNDSNFFGMKQLLFKGSAFNFDFLFNTVKKWYPYDESKIDNPNRRFIIGATNCDTGEPVYFEKQEYVGLTHALQASASIPLLCKKVHIDGMDCIDGGVADPIPIRKALADEHNKVVLILTRDSKYIMKHASGRTRFLYKRVYRKYPQLIESFENRPQNYNALTEEINEMEANNKIYVIRPRNEVTIKGLERDARTLLDLYFRGRDDARELLPKMNEYLNSNKSWDK